MVEKGNGWAERMDRLNHTGISIKIARHDHTRPKKRKRFRLWENEAGGRKGAGLALQRGRSRTTGGWADGMTMGTGLKRASLHVGCSKSGACGP